MIGGPIIIHLDKPKKDVRYGVWVSGQNIIMLEDDSYFPEVQYKDKEPTRAKIIISKD